jgi:Gpi18-like mannosyltransferase
MIPDFQRVAPYIFGLLFIGAVVLRIALFHVQTSDYTFFLSNWYDFIKSHNGFAAFKSSFSNYNVPYLYLLAILTYTPIPKLIAIKSLSVLFDALLGLFTYLIISLKYPRSYAAIIGVLVVLYTPTIFINSAAWGQADATYTAFCLGSLYFLLKKRPAWACVFFGLAISFKLQAIFFLPVLLVFAVAIPFLLPEMHERYFYLADVLSILYAFYYPRRFYVPILVQFCSLFSYAPYFLGRQIIPLSYLAGIELLVVIITTVDLVMELYPEQFKRIPPRHEDVSLPDRNCVLVVWRVNANTSKSGVRPWYDERASNWRVEPLRRASAVLHCGWHV